MKKIVIMTVLLILSGAAFAGTNLVQNTLSVDALLQRYDSNTLRPKFDTWDSYYMMNGSTNHYGVYSKELEALLTNCEASREKFKEFQEKATGGWVLFGISTTAYLGGFVTIIALMANDTNTNNLQAYATAMLGTIAVYYVTAIIGGSIMTEASESLSLSIWQYNRAVLTEDKPPLAFEPYRRQPVLTESQSYYPIFSYSFGF